MGAHLNAASRLNAFESMAQGYNGATGIVDLNAAGDRANGAFNYWGLQYENGSYTWVKVGQSE